MHITSIKYSDKPFALSNHYHDGHQILYVKKGEVNITVGKEKYKFKSGDLVVLSRMKEHSVDVVGDEYKRYTLRVSPESGAVAENLVLSTLFADKEGFEYGVSLGTHNDEFEHFFIVKEFTEKKNMYNEVLDLIFNNFLIALHRKFPHMFVENINENMRVVYEIQRKLETEYFERYTLNALSKEYNISVSHLSHLFKNITGYAPMEYLEICRLIAAKKYLSSTRMPIKEIVASCGFTDESNFCRMFKKKTNMTPTEFRNRYLC